MAKEKKVKVKGFNSIATIDPNTLDSFRFKQNEIAVNNLDKTSKADTFFASYINTKDVISATVEISRNIPDEDLSDSIEIKAYEELGLDSTTEYTFIHKEIESSGNKNRLYNIFAIDTALIHTQFSEAISKVRYIDYITAAPFLIKSLYRRNVIESEGNECFIYFQKNDSFLAIYKAGEYLYSKSLNYSLVEINEKFCELAGERVDEQVFYEMLLNKGFKSANPSYQQYMMQLFGEIFLYVNDVLAYAKRSYKLEYIHKLYIGSEIGIFHGLDEYSKSYLGLDSNDFLFNIAINQKDWYIDQMHILLILTSQIFIEDKEDSLNITFFKRPPSFLKRPSGQIIVFSVISILAALVYPASQYGYGYYLNMEEAKLNQEYNSVHSQASKIEQDIKRLTGIHEDVSKKVKAQFEKVDYSERLLKTIFDKKSNYAMKSVVLYDVSRFVNNRGVKIDNIVENNRDLNVSVISNNEKKLTELLKDITASKNYSVSTNKIKKDENTSLYLSNFLVEVK